MTRQINAVEINKFVAGLITEASPLTFPPNASLDEDNFVLYRDGSRDRRLGMDYESGYVNVVTDVTVPGSSDIATTSIRWSNAGGDASKNLLVVQIGNQIKIFEAASTPISGAVIYTRTFNQVAVDKPFSYAVVDGTLVVATGLKDISIFKYAGGLVTSQDRSLNIRDQFGVTDIVDGVNLREGNGVTVRPTTRAQPHIYNLRNQTFAVPRKVVTDESVQDPISYFRSLAGRDPSNSDAVTGALYADANDSDDRLSERFNARDIINSPVGTYPAPRGYFIIDAMARGTSRLAEYQKLMAQYTQLNIPVTALPVDTTPGGPSVLSEYSGRVFYSGFSGELIGGDENSPRMSSYVLFSQLVEDPTDITTCYQDGDPTSKDSPDLLDTDGGFIRIEGAYNIVRLINIGNALAVLAANGVWLIQGGSDYGFKATNYMTTKVTTHGCDSPSSVVAIDNTFMYWSDDGIYNVAPNQYGDYIAENISQKTIQKFYDSIDPLDRRACKGSYDTYEKKVRWLYAGRIASVNPVRELVLDTTLGSFYPATIGFMDQRLPLPIAGIIVPPFRATQIDIPVTVDTEPVTASGKLVITRQSVIHPSTRETIYAIITGTSPTISFTFGSYKDTFHRDWRTFDGVGIDAPSFLLTGWQSANDFQRNKQVPYITLHFQKTETGFADDFVPVNPSSCLMQAQWDWSNSANSGKWGRTVQTYRHRRHYMPNDLSDTYDDGNLTVRTRNKLRGSGRVVSLLFKSEPDKHMHILGWSMIMGINSNV
ncbi:hypothetical protein [Pseudomonas phage GP100]|nr:hypothetical protein [Pseudomonas phage GP100]